ncbi:MAG: hypothetical protein GX259_04035 [Bacteroidales bacterium]|jgi:hypothetical protein|nr:hypothetical protein [Bacteroidales bacterium]
MKQITFLLIFIVVGFLNIKAQTTQDFLESCVEEEQINGAKSIIINANICSCCMTEPVFAGRIFIKDSTNTYKVRYLKYVNGYASVKVLKDSTYEDSNIKEIFEIAETFQDSIFEQLSIMDSLLTVKIVKEGQLVYREPLMHGKMKYVGLFFGDKSKTTINSVMNLNNLFEKAYYYWLLSSSINNYIIDLRE